MTSGTAYETASNAAAQRTARSWPWRRAPTIAIATGTIASMANWPSTMTGTAQEETVTARGVGRPMGASEGDAVVMGFPFVRPSAPPRSGARSRLLERRAYVRSYN
ncbi:hypothetical protein GCM10020219_056990 [Nonomuraea dietziae]